MTENTLLYHFHTSRKLSDKECLELAAICHGTDVSNIKCLYSQTDNEDLQLALYQSLNNKFLNLRFYPKQLLYTVDVHLMDFGQDASLSFIRQIETRLRDLLNSMGALVKFHSLFVPIRRGQSLWRCFATADERLYEADFDKIVEDVDSPYQNIKIYHSIQHGNVLYLDDDVMFGESDQEAYSRVLLGLETGKEPRHNYEGKEILILGGGDGGVICELLKQKPKMVVMCEIDDEVVRLCRRHLRSACEDAMDTYEESNKKIIIGDCLQHLHECIQSGKRYDFIVNDLTEFPVNKEERGWVYDFATDNSQVMELALKALKPDGFYLSRGGSVSAKFFWDVFEKDCAKIGCKFRSFDSHVPSFYEDYRLYEAWFPASGDSAGNSA